MVIKMEKLGVIAILTLVLLILPMVSAIQPNQQYNKILLNPLYRQSMDPDIPYSYNITINPIDGVLDIQSAIITFQIWLNPTIEFFIDVDGQQCNTPSFEVHTTYAGAGEGTIFFDCSNVINKSGTYNVTLTPDDDTGAITGWADITYSNDPRGSLEVHGTEYVAGQRAKVWVQLLDNNGSDVTEGVCYVNIYTPDNEVYIEGATMTNMGHDGIYTFDLVAPQQQGVYPAIARCFYTASQEFEYADDFTLNWGKDEEGDYLKTYTLNGDEHKYKELEDGSGNRRLNFTYHFEDMCGINIAEELLTSLTITTNQKWESITNDDITIYIWNYTDSTWIPLDNKIHSPNNRITVTNSISINNVTSSGLVDSSGDLMLFFKDTDIVDDRDTKIEMDLLSVSCDQLSNSEWQEVKGSSELHISSDNDYVYKLERGELTNKTFNEDFTFHFIISSQASILEEEAAISLQLWKPFPCDHILDVKERFINGTVIDLNYTGVTDDNGRCQVNIIKDLEILSNYDIEVRTENNWKVRMYEDYSTLLLQEEMVNISCQNYVQANNLTNFTIPINSTFEGYDPMWLSCAAYLDTSYHYKEIIANFIYISNTNYNFTYNDMQSLETQWKHLIDIKEIADGYFSIIADGLNLADSYSLGLVADPYPPTNPNYVKYFASISSSYLNYVALLGNPTNVWSYENRTVTGGNVSIDTSLVAAGVWNYDNRTINNVTNIVNGVWSYSESIGANLITQLVQAVWDYAGTPSTTLLNNFTSSVWSNDNRTLTDYLQNDTTTAEAIWNHFARYTHGEIA